MSKPIVLHLIATKSSLSFMNGGSKPLIIGKNGVLLTSGQTFHLQDIDATHTVNVEISAAEDVDEIRYPFVLFPSSAGTTTHVMTISMALERNAELKKDNENIRWVLQDPEPTEEDDI